MTSPSGKDPQKSKTEPFPCIDDLTAGLSADKSLSYISADSLQNDTLDQKIVTCGHSLAAMAASGQFLDDGSCQ